MGIELASNNPSGGAERPAPPGRLEGRLLLATKVAWLAVAALAVGLFVASLPAVFGDLATACAGPSCVDGRLGPAAARDLRALGISMQAYALYGVGQQVVWACVWCAVGFLIFWRKPDNPMALVSGLTLVTVGATFTNAPQALAAPAWDPPVAFVTFAGQACFILFLFLFPDGRFAPRWTRYVALGAVALYAPAYLMPDSPLGLDRWPTGLTLVLTVGLLVVAVAAQVHRYRRVSGATGRRQTRWVVFGLAVGLGGFVGLILVGALSSEAPDGPLTDLAFNTVIFALMLPIPLSTGVAVLRHRLWDIDLVINRALVYAALTALVVGLYVLVVGYLGALLRTENNLLVSLVATGLVAMLFQPTRERLQRAVNRMMYGERDDPYRVLSSMGERLEATLAPNAVLPAIVETVREALRLPYAAVALPRDGSFEVAAHSGEPGDREALTLPLTYGGEAVGRLLLSPRVGEDGFSRADRRLLDDLARHAGLAVHGVRVMDDLRRSREGLVLAREEERRRLRRDLHDELAPTIAALGLGAATVGELIPTDPEGAASANEKLRTTIRSTVGDVRRLVYDLRPPALDELGLVGAVKERAARLEADDGTLRVTVEAPEALPPLPAAVEVAAYRIAQEALTNVSRHADAGRCGVRISPDRGAAALVVEVEDDGRGLGGTRTTGVGLHFMRERAEELGGTCVVGPAPTGGTRVRASLPLRAARGTERGGTYVGREPNPSERPPFARAPLDGPDAGTRAGG